MRSLRKNIYNRVLYSEPNEIVKVFPKPNKIEYESGTPRIDKMSRIHCICSVHLLSIISFPLA